MRRTADCFRIAEHQILNLTGYGDIPCGSTENGFTQCCAAGDECLEGGICHFAHSSTAGYSGFYVGGCTDESVTDPSCLQSCGKSQSQSQSQSTSKSKSVFLPPLYLPFAPARGDDAMGSQYSCLPGGTLLCPLFQTVMPNSISCKARPTRSGTAAEPSTEAPTAESRPTRPFKLARQGNWPPLRPRPRPRRRPHRHVRGPPPYLQPLRRLYHHHHHHQPQSHNQVHW